MPADGLCARAYKPLASLRSLFVSGRPPCPLPVDAQPPRAQHVALRAPHPHPRRPQEAGRPRRSPPCRPPPPLPPRCLPRRSLSARNRSVRLLALLTYTRSDRPDPHPASRHQPGRSSSAYTSATGPPPTSSRPTLPAPPSPRTSPTVSQKVRSLPPYLDRPADPRLVVPGPSDVLRSTCTGQGARCRVCVDGQTSWPAARRPCQLQGCL